MTARRRCSPRAAATATFLFSSGVSAFSSWSVKNHQRPAFALLESAAKNAAAAAVPSFADTTRHYGGDYAGLSATFSSSTGALIPVPIHLVPDSLVEWGQVPSYLEVIVSEDLADGVLTRHTVTVIPAVGCGVDNLETMKSQDSIVQESLKLVVDDTSSGVVALEYPLPPQRDMSRSRVETTFTLPNDNQRMRVMMDILQGNQIQSPITLVLERRTSATSTGGTIANGGGLDGRTVATLLGDDLRQKPFSQTEALPFAPIQDSGTAMIHLNLPGNVTIAYGSPTSQEWIVDVGHVSDGVTRNIVRRRYTEQGTLQEPVELRAESIS